MAREQSADEVRREHVRLLGDDLGSMYNALYVEVTWLHAKWLQYRKLFGTSEERVCLLNESAPFFFRIIQDVLWEDVVLHISRLTDPPTIGGRENLSLHCIPSLIRNVELSERMRELLRIVEERVRFARTWRNKKLAHHDRALALDAQAVPLQRASRQQVEDALEGIRAVMNGITQHYCDSETAFQSFLAYHDADTLIHQIAIAMRYDERRRQRFEKGMPLAEDLELPPRI